ncbi:uncharacterized protein SPPG_07994 [Spizellomyces punctatus DAOM BR117]|uniref:NmrA-like domain-containing protein n=1 Tax=Spizellomyces punctatus (strain DAOM BR117) TaxID=645134 RepID=A0A0L0H748_SPIPD|nr:uncharacterized protein SPPG_07994 [Spizellomyces punctatus DAOM BR117]KNC96789.1 hypothetical protein SPPG_07994 [Spizellomyces punctatus DAOM BR117]|eukprot:XP_016604829.1 hypothetical protein SPPG_07994 [Spizellomyces punctatus DAOM BR117]
MSTSEQGVIAVAGGTGGLGRHIVEELVEDCKYKVVVLSRTPNPSLTALGVDVRPIDYTSHTSIVKALENVHTLISCIAAGGDALADVQIKLLRAAEAAGVKRFAPSEWASDTQINTNIEGYFPKKAVIEELQKSKLEWTLFMNGVFMNYLASPRGTGHLQPLKFVIDTENRTANIPGTGNEPVVMTTVQDVAKFVVGSLSLPSWPEKSGIIGDLTTYNHVVKAAERITGEKFKVEYRSLEQLNKAIHPDAQSIMENFYTQVCIAIAEGAKGGFVFEGTLNKLLPHIKTVSVDEFLAHWWTPSGIGKSK